MVILICLSVPCYWLDQILIITPWSANLEFWRKKQNKTKKTTKKKQEKSNCNETNKIIQVVMEEFNKIQILSLVHYSILSLKIQGFSREKHGLVICA